MVDYIRKSKNYNRKINMNEEERLQRLSVQFRVISDLKKQENWKVIEGRIIEVFEKEGIESGQKGKGVRINAPDQVFYTDDDMARFVKEIFDMVFSEEILQSEMDTLSKRVENIKKRKYENDNN